MQLRFEAAVAGVVPVIRVIQESLAAIEISRISGIVNGTTNFILSEMASTGASYGDALARAQELGYAEADPSEDVGGADAAAKMAILARLAFDTPVGLDDVTYEGIAEIQPDDIAYAKELGLSLKLLGVAERRGEGISVRVFPCFLYRGHPLAPVEGPFNAVTVEAPAITEITMSGPGAGGVETATAVLGDVVSILAGEAPVDQPRLELEIVTDVNSSFYLHLEVADRPGVLARIAEVLGRNGISVKSVVQRGLGDDARLVMVIHERPEGRFYAALERDRRARLPARGAARDPGDRGGVRVNVALRAAASVDDAEPVRDARRARRSTHYIERLGLRPGPMDADYGEPAEAGELWVAGDPTGGRTSSSSSAPRIRRSLDVIVGRAGAPGARASARR